MTAPALHLEALLEKQREVLAALAPIARELGFHLAGGTAVALRLGHRVSVDLDFFTPSQAFDPLAILATLRARCLRLADAEIGEGVLHARLDGVRLTFLRYRHPLLEPIENAGGIEIASMPDLACMKLAATVQRGAKKDFFDLAAICARTIELGQLLALYQRKFDLSGFGHALVALAYFDDAEADPDPIILDGTTWEEVKRRIRAWVKEISRP